MAYYSGQGNIYVAERNVDGTPKGFVHVGNVPALEISIETTKFEHKESMSGSRAVDLTIVQEKKGTFTMTLEDMDLDNLALGFWGINATTVGAAVTIFQLKTANLDVHATKELVVPLIHPATGVVYADITTATYTIADTEIKTITYEFGDSDTNLVDSKNGWLDLDTGDIHIYSTAKQTSRGATVNLVQDDDLWVEFTHGAIDNMAAFTQTSQQRWIRFSGLNTIDNEPVVIDMYKADLDPLTGYGLINEELSTFDITGSLLFDNLQPGTSKFFSQTVKSV